MGPSALGRGRPLSYVAPSLSRQSSLLGPLQDPLPTPHKPHSFPGPWDQHVPHTMIALVLNVTRPPSLLYRGVV